MVQYHHFKSTLKKEKKGLFEITFQVCVLISVGNLDDFQRILAVVIGYSLILIYQLLS